MAGHKQKHTIKVAIRAPALRTPNRFVIPLESCLFAIVQTRWANDNIFDAGGLAGNRAAFLGILKTRPTDLAAQQVTEKTFDAALIFE